MFSAVVIDPRAVMGVSHAIIRSLQVRPCLYLSILLAKRRALLPRQILKGQLLGQMFVR